MKIKNFLTLTLFILLSFSNLNKVYSIEPDVFVQSTVNRVSKVLSSNLSKENKIQKIKNIADETVDIEILGLYTLGSYRKILNDDQKKELIDLVTKQLHLKKESHYLELGDTGITPNLSSTGG